VAIVFARRGAAIVAGCAVGGNACVIEPCARKTHRTSVASLAGLVRLDVAIVFARRGAAIVAGRAVGGDAGVIEPSACKTDRTPVACLARLVRLDVAIVFAGRGAAIVAGRAVGSDAGVIESRRRRETHRASMARLALVRRQHMTGRLAWCIPAIVATHTCAHGHRVFETRVLPCAAIMAALTEVIRLHMIL
jgi:hypothetical protein